MFQPGHECADGPDGRRDDREESPQPGAQRHDPAAQPLRGRPLVPLQRQLQGEHQGEDGQSGPEIVFHRRNPPFAYGFGFSWTGRFRVPTCSIRMSKRYSTGTCGYRSCHRLLTFLHTPGWLRRSALPKPKMSALKRVWISLTAAETSCRIRSSIAFVIRLLSSKRTRACSVSFA